MIEHARMDLPRSRLWLGLGSWHQQRRDYAAAEQAYANALVGTDNLANVHYALAHVIQRQGRHRDAVPHYEFARQHGKADADLLGDLAVALLLTGQPAIAEQRIAEAVQLAPNHARHRQNWALILRRLGREAEAAAQESEARQISGAGTTQVPIAAPPTGPAK